ncbi:hypothetical protein ES703_73839 [subsurface metagenome]
MPKSKPQKQRNPIRSKEDRYVEEHHQGSHKITKKEFMVALTKAAQPVSEWQHDQEGTETLEFHPSDGCNETRKNQDKTEGEEG